MSRIGKKPIDIPDGVKVTVQDCTVEVNSSKGKIKESIPENITVAVQDKKITVTRHNEDKKTRAYQGLVRALLNNAVIGVSTGYQKALQIFGTGYNARLKGKTLELQVGFILPIVMEIPEGLTVETPTPIRIVVKGCNKQQVTQFAARIRRVREPDSYKGKGIRYDNEVFIPKPGKSFAGAGASEK